MKKIYYPSKSEALAACILIVLVFALALWVVYLLLQPKGRVSCADFGSYSDALVYYKNGNTQLDRGGLIGVPCETLYNKSKRK